MAPRAEETIPKNPTNATNVEPATNNHARPKTYTALYAKKMDHLKRTSITMPPTTSLPSTEERPQGKK